MLFLARRLNLKMQTGDRFEITVVETGDGNVTLGISAPDRKPFKKAIVEDNNLATAKPITARRQLRQSVPAPASAPATPFIERRRAR